DVLHQADRPDPASFAVDLAVVADADPARLAVRPDDASLEDVRRVLPAHLPERGADVLEVLGVEAGEAQLRRLLIAGAGQARHPRELGRNPEGLPDVIDLVDAGLRRLQGEVQAGRQVVRLA